MTRLYGKSIVRRFIHPPPGTCADGRDGTRPIKGGSVTGNLFEAMAAARFSSETSQFPSFAGPRAIRFESMQVAGDDA